MDTYLRCRVGTGAVYMAVRNGRRAALKFIQRYNAAGAKWGICRSSKSLRDKARCGDLHTYIIDDKTGAIACMV